MTQVDLSSSQVKGSMATKSVAKRTRPNLRSKLGSLRRDKNTARKIERKISSPIRPCSTRTDRKAL